VDIDLLFDDFEDILLGHSIEYFFVKIQQGSISVETKLSWAPIAGFEYRVIELIIEAIAGIEGFTDLLLGKGSIVELVLLRNTGIC